MAEYLVTDTDLTTIADAIRAKSGTTEQSNFPGGFVSAISAIEAGGGGNDSFKALVEGTITEVSDDTIETIRSRCFYGCSTLTKISFPLVTDIPSYAFYGCKNLISIDLPNVKSVGSYGFFNANTSGLRTEILYLPNVLNIGDHAFHNCYPKLIRMPNVKTVDDYAFYPAIQANTITQGIEMPNVEIIGSSAFYRFMTVKTIDFLNLRNIQSYAFQACRSLVAFINRKTDGVCVLSNANAFDGCVHITGTVDSTYNPDGLRDGYFYVPSALLDSYKAATNWVTFADQFRALEDYTVDGTITGELDPEKI